MNNKDIKNLELLLYHCYRMQRHVDYFGDDENEYITNEHYQAACSLEILEIGEYINRLSNEFINEHDFIDLSGFIGMKVIHTHHRKGLC